ncbi:MAG: 5-(carboxyamino)imidazole ribonucleotide synthase [Pseudomonadota bacterium]
MQKNLKEERVGILGKGQLGIMLGQAAAKLGVPVWFYEPSTQVLSEGDTWQGTEKILATGKDAWDRFSTSCSVYTYESEHVPHDFLLPLSAQHKLNPPFKAVQETGHRILEKQCFKDLRIPTAPWKPVTDQPSFIAAVTAIGLPAILKTATQGYDGKGQQWLRSQADVDAAKIESGREYVLEGVIHFELEFSVIGARDAKGNEEFYPIGENLHEKGILRTTLVPASLPDKVTEAARGFLSEILQHYNYVGVMALECFYSNGNLYANELAPRVHNSGHWSIEGSNCSQFEQHIRAITGRPLVAIDLVSQNVGMVNCLGVLPPDTVRADWPKGLCFYYDYHKGPRPNGGHEPGRKLGHVTVVSDDRDMVKNELARLRIDCKT